MIDIALLGVFFAIALIHLYVEEHSHKISTAWLAFLAHPAVIVTLKDWAIHIFVYSKYALFTH